MLSINNAYCFGEMEYEMKRRILAFFLTGALMLSTMTGCVKIVKAGEEGKLTGTESVDASTKIDEVWQSKAIPELEGKAVDVVQLLTEAKGNISSLGDKYGKHAQGKDSALNFTVKGTCTVQSVNTESRVGFIQVKLDGYNGDEVIKLQVGPVFKGTAPRDSLDMIKFEQYKNQVDYAAVSTSINNMITNTVFKNLDVASLNGKQIEFVGCFTLDKSNELIITPVEIKVK
jgi:predicted lipoprotein